MGVQKATIPWKKFWKFLIKSIMHLSCDTAIPYLGIYTRKIKTCPQKDLFKNVHSTPKIFTVVKNLEQLRWLSTGKWTGRHTMEYNPTKSNKLLVCATTWMNLKIMMSEVLPKSTTCTIPFTWNSNISKTCMYWKKSE